MIKHFCDICGKEIEDADKASHFKVKKEVLSWYDSWWERMYVHIDCWRDMCKYIKKGRDNGEEEKDG